MAQFDVYKNENPLTKQTTPYLLDVQNDTLKSLSTRVVVPLSINRKIIQGLTKKFVIEDTTVYMQTAQMGTVHITELLNKVDNLSQKSEDIKNSLDFVIYGI